MQAGLIKKEKVARSSVPPSIITERNDLADKVAASRIDTKQFITAQTFVSAEDGVGGHVRQAIAKQNLVAVTVNVDVERGVANRSRPVTTSTSRRRIDRRRRRHPTTEYLLQNVKVLAVGVATVPQQAAPTADAAGRRADRQSGLLTFEVTTRRRAAA